MRTASKNRIAAWRRWCASARSCGRCSTRCRRPMARAGDVAAASIDSIDARCRPRLAAKARLRFDKRESKHILLYPERGLLLNDTAAAILQACDGSRTLDEIVEVLA